MALPGDAGFPLLINGTLWITIQNADATGHGRLARIDSASGRLRSYPVPVVTSRLAYGFGSVWITGSGKVVRLDAASGRVMSIIRGPRMFGPAIAATSDGVWVGGADVYASGQGDKTLMHWIYKIDPRRNTVVRQVYLRPTTALDFAGDGGQCGSVVGAASEGVSIRTSPLPAALRWRRVVAGADTGRGLGDAGVLGEPSRRTATPTATVTAGRHLGAAEGNHH